MFACALMRNERGRRAPQPNTRSIGRSLYVSLIACQKRVVTHAHCFLETILLSSQAHGINTVSGASGTTVRTDRPLHPPYRSHIAATARIEPWWCFRKRQLQCDISQAARQRTFPFPRVGHARHPFCCFGTSECTFLTSGNAAV